MSIKTLYENDSNRNIDNHLKLLNQYQKIKDILNKRDNE